MNIRHFEDIVDLEKVIIAALVKGQKQDSILFEISENDFYDQGLARIFKVCMQLYVEGVSIDEHTVSSKIPRKEKKELENCLALNFSASSLPHIISSVKNARKIRNLNKLTEDVKLMTLNPECEAEAIFGSLHSGLMDLLVAGHEKSILTPNDLIDEILVDLRTPDEDNSTVYSYLRSLDDLYTFGKGELTLVAARPSVGKSQLLLQVCLENALRGIPVLFFSMEMTKKVVMHRLISNACEIDLYKLRKKRLSGAEMDRVEKFTPKLKSIPLYFECVGSVNSEEVRSRARKISLQSKNLGFIAIDYLQLMKTGNEGNRNLEVESIAKDMKSLAMELEVPVICISQLSRGVESREDKRPMLSDLRDSGALEQAADGVIFLFKEALYTRRKEDENKLELIVAKQRNGPVGTLELENISKFQKIIDKEIRNNEGY